MCKDVNFQEQNWHVSVPVIIQVRSKILYALTLFNPGFLSDYSKDSKALVMVLATPESWVRIEHTYSSIGIDKSDVIFEQYLLFMTPQIRLKQMMGCMQ